MNLLTPDRPRHTLATVPTDEGEPPGVGPVLGSVVGAAAGAATGAQLATAAAGLLTVPGLGPILATGMIAGAIVGLGAGATIGRALENVLINGVPRDELFVYEDALRKERTIVIALAENETQAAAVRSIFNEGGAESVDAARESWWVGLRESERVHYEATGGDFDRDEKMYRAGFEAARHPHLRGRTYAQCVVVLREESYPNAYAEEAFRRGYERGQAYERATRDANRG